MGRADRRLHPSHSATVDDIIPNTTYIGKVHDWTENYKRAATRVTALLWTWKSPCQDQKRAIGTSKYAGKKEQWRKCPDSGGRSNYQDDRYQSHV